MPFRARPRRSLPVIARLAQTSASAKGFTLTIAAAAFGFSALNEAWYLSLLGIASADIVMTGGGSGKHATAFEFSLNEIVMA